jgi:hypothetical protein
LRPGSASPSVSLNVRRQPSGYRLPCMSTGAKRLPSARAQRSRPHADAGLADTRRLPIVAVSSTRSAWGKNIVYIDCAARFPRVGGDPSGGFCPVDKSEDYIIVDAVRPDRRQSVLDSTKRRYVQLGRPSGLLGIVDGNPTLQAVPEQSRGSSGHDYSSSMAAKRSDEGAHPKERSKA